MQAFRTFARYRPPHPIPFSSGRYLLYSHPKVQSYVHWGQTAAYGSTVFFGMRLLLRGASMGWISWLLQTGLFVGSYSMTTKLREVSKHTALKVYLKSDGQTLEIQTGLLTQLCKTTEVPISDITEDQEGDERLKAMTMYGGFQAISTRRGDTFLLWPNGTVADMELLKKIIEGCELDLKESDKVDIIDV